MTDQMMNLRTLLEESADADLLREMVGICRAAPDGAGGGEDGSAEELQREPSLYVPLSNNF
jgi:hypothetical protein